MTDRKFESLTIAELWTLYASWATPKDIPEEGKWVLDEIRKAFHAGASAGIVLGQRLLSEGIDAERQKAIWLKLEKELREYDLAHADVGRAN